MPRCGRPGSSWGAEMAIRAEHELHRRRLGRNVGLGVTLIAFVVLVFALTVVKVTTEGGLTVGDALSGAPHPASTTKAEGTP